MEKILSTINGQIQLRLDMVKQQWQKEMSDLKSEEEAEQTKSPNIATDIRNLITLNDPTKKDDTSLADPADNNTTIGSSASA